MNPEKLIQQQAESALQHRTTRRGLFRGAGKGAAGLAIGGVAASLGALLFSSCYPGRSNAITGRPHAVLAARCLACRLVPLRLLIPG